MTQRRLHPKDKEAGSVLEITISFVSYNKLQIYLLRKDENCNKKKLNLCHTMCLVLFFKTYKIPSKF